jgi:hypothetical protein
MPPKFVQSRIDVGKAKGPRLALMYHMAEGANTVNFLSLPITKKRNPRKVSVHGVIQKDGTFVQMLDYSHMHTSLNPKVKSTNKKFFGVNHLNAVLGKFAAVATKPNLGPNHATLAVEIEGFAAAGPNPAQVKTAIAWGLEMRERFPTIRGALGHADQTNTKKCPGTTPAMQEIFEGVGGHGLWEGPMLAFKILENEEGAGCVTVKGDGHSAIVLATGKLFGLANGIRKRSYAKIRLDKPFDKAPGDRRTGYLIGEDGALMLATAVTFVPDSGMNPSPCG